jgi:hypothetical protein
LQANARKVMLMVRGKRAAKTFHEATGFTPADDHAMVMRTA